jgi:toxin ParE1/3/4
MRYQLSKAAAQDLEDIYLYGFMQFGEAQADRYAAMLEERIQLLCDNPLLGRIDAAINPAIRRFECESHVIFYDLTATHLFLVRILHGATDYLRHLAWE